MSKLVKKERNFETDFTLSRMGFSSHKEYIAYCKTDPEHHAGRKPRHDKKALAKLKHRKVRITKLEQEFLTSFMDQSHRSYIY